MNIFNKIVITKPQEWLVEAASSIGLDYSGLSHEVTIFFLEHVIKRHNQGNLAITEGDYKKLLGLVKAPDLAIIGATRGKRPSMPMQKGQAGKPTCILTRLWTANATRRSGAARFIK